MGVIIPIFLVWLAVHVFSLLIKSYKEKNKKEMPYALKVFLALLLTCFFMFMFFILEGPVANRAYEQMLFLNKSLFLV